MDDDFNTAGALAALFDVTREVNTLLNADKPVAAADLRAMQAMYARLAGDVLGLVPPAESASTGLTSELVELLLETRRALRAAKQWALADEIRDRLGSMGVVLQDGATGTTWTLSARGTA
jgi:cysteinyl-tRNA synthetase